MDKRTVIALLLCGLVLLIHLTLVAPWLKKVAPSQGDNQTVAVPPSGDNLTVAPAPTATPGPTPMPGPTPTPAPAAQSFIAAPDQDNVNDVG